MRIKSWISDILLTFVVTFVVAAVVTLAWRFISDGTAVVEWRTALRLAIIFGIVLPITRRLGQGK